MSSGRYGAPSSRIVTRRQLRPRPRPQGQCVNCFDAGVSFEVSRKYCENCKGGVIGLSADEALRAHRVAEQQLPGQLAKREQAEGRQQAGQPGPRAYPHAVSI